MTFFADDFLFTHFKLQNLLFSPQVMKLLKGFVLFIAKTRIVLNNKNSRAFPRSFGIFQAEEFFLKEKILSRGKMVSSFHRPPTPHHPPLPVYFNLDFLIACFNCSFHPFFPLIPSPFLRFSFCLLEFRFRMCNLSLSHYSNDYLSSFCFDDQVAAFLFHRVSSTPLFEVLLSGKFLKPAASALINKIIRLPCGFFFGRGGIA